ncbi:hypothetical protein N7488_008733 [Penicillium malachiteum]|nr:hypothetical protein N7488_008733 [Penicillium malachiteum]
MARKNANSPNDPAQIATIMLSWHDLELISCTTLQTLWAGYGQICALTVRATTDKAAAHLSQLCGTKLQGAGSTLPLILKLISPPSHNRMADEGHLRKMLSYEVEQYFYSEVVPALGDEVAVAKCLASTRDLNAGPRKDGQELLEGLMAIIMVDLRPAFPVCGGKRSTLSRIQVHGALDWLARFHRRSWYLLPRGLDGYVLPPLDESKRREESGTRGDGLWLNGGYTYLATRRTEYRSLVQDTDSEWCKALCTRVSDESPLSIAEMVALVMTPCGRDIESYIHGDVKSENLFTTSAGDGVAFFDFQYVGLGLGACDLAKLFTCSVPMDMLVDDEDYIPEQLPMCKGEKELLQRYHANLLQNKGSGFYEWDEFRRHWETALVDWCRFQASWGFWGNTEWLEARVRSILSDLEWWAWLDRSVKSRKD